MQQIAAKIAAPITLATILSIISIPPSISTNKQRVPYVKTELALSGRRLTVHRFKVTPYIYCNQSYPQAQGEHKILYNLMKNA